MSNLIDFPPAARRRWTFRLLTLLLVWIAVEVVASVGLYLVGGAGWGVDQRRLADTGLSVGDAGELLHPFVGIALPPSPPNADRSNPYSVINELGFPHATSPVQKRDPGRFVIGIVGGSVARHFATLGQARLVEQLSASPELQGREIRVVCLAIEGFKQPQQLLGVGYVLSLGGEFDAIIAIDGSNEVAVGDGNIEAGANFAYPRSWRFHAAQPGALETLSSGALRVQQLQEVRHQVALSAKYSLFRWSAVRQVVWKLHDLMLRDAQRRAAEDVTNFGEQQQRSFRVLGPAQHFRDESEKVKQLVNLWECGSRNLQHLAEGEGFVYLHCLQPSTVVPMTKPLTAEELAEVRKFTPRTAGVLQAGYPLLREAGVRLAANGEHFRDLSDPFAGVTETLFLDTCHLNQRGNDLLAERIASELIEILGSQSETKSAR